MSTFLQLTNKLLRRFNEVELTNSTFGNAKGVHGLAKDAIVASLNDINQQNWKWPFNYVGSGTGTIYVTGVVGQEEYNYPLTAEDIDLDNIYIQPISGTITATKLGKVEHDQYKRYYRKESLDANTAASYSAPKIVTRTPSATMVVHPKPDLAYVFIVPHWVIPTEPSAYNDVVRVPPRFDDVIIEGAMWHLHSMRGNIQEASLTKKEAFMARVKQMRTLLINQNNSMTSTSIDRRSGYSLRYIDSN